MPLKKQRELGNFWGFVVGSGCSILGILEGGCGWKLENLKEKHRSRRATISKNFDHCA